MHLVRLKQARHWLAISSCRTPLRRARAACHRRLHDIAASDSVAFSVDPAESLAAMMKRKFKAEEGVAKAAEGDAPPQKRYFRSRAHINPLNATTDDYEYPITPDRMDWQSHFPSYPELATAPHSTCPRYVEVADVGCGFGGLLVGLSPLLASSLMVGMEIRPKVTEYVRLRLLAMRKAEDKAHNASVIKTNAMKLLPHFFFKGQLSKLFFCFPDPHFKKATVRRRIVTVALLAEYAYSLREGGLLYTITDVRDLHNWMVANCEIHPLFERVSDEELASDPCVPVMRTYTEEGQKVERLQGQKFVAVFRRISPEKAAEREAALTGGDFWSEPTLTYEHRRAKHRSEYHL